MDVRPQNLTTPNTANAWRVYVIPMVLFLILTSLEGMAPLKPHYVWVYILKVLLVSGALWACRAAWKDIRVDVRVLPIAILVGLLVLGEWVWLEKVLTYPHLGTRTALNPLEAIHDPLQRGLFLTFRFIGLAIMVPVMEELFWRSFLIRWITKPEFDEVPIGTFSWGAFAAVAALFGLAHPEWLVAVICAVAYGLLLKRTRSLFACVVAHAVTNLGLGIYVLASGDWRFW